MKEKNEMNSGFSSKNDVIVKMAYLLGQRIATQTEILSFIYLTFFSLFQLLQFIYA